MTTEYKWYPIFVLSDFLDADVPARTLNLNLTGKGLTTFELFRGNYVSVLYDGWFLPVNEFNSSFNPFVQDAYAVYLDSDSGQVYFGFEVT